MLERIDVTFSHGRIYPVDSFERTAKAISKLLHKDGYLYPPIEKERVLSEGGCIRTIPKSKRPAGTYCVKPSHVLEMVPQHHEAKIREESAAFIIFLLGFLFETRLQFENWWIDGKIAISRGNILTGYPVVLGNQLSLAYGIWSSWQKTEKMRFLNILYIFSRSDIYDWDWERFLFQYSVVDACWAMGKAIFQFKAKSHGQRIHELYSYFGIHESLLEEAKIYVKLRNDLVHEAKWLGGRPSHVNPLSSGPGFDAGTRMAWLNRHVIAGFLNLPRDF